MDCVELTIPQIEEIQREGPPWASDDVDALCQTALSAIRERDQWKTACHATVSGSYRALSYLKALALNHAEAARYGVMAAIRTLEEPASKYTTDLSTARAEAATLTAERDALRAAVKKAEWRATWDTAPGSMEIGATLPSTESQAIADLERLSRYPRRYVNFGKNILDAPNYSSDYELDSLFGPDHEDGWLLMLYTWCDESGHEQKDEFMFVAGFLGNREQWNQFKRRWVEMGGTPSFRTKEVLRNPERAERKLANLAPVPASCGLRPIAAGVRMADYWDLVEGSDDERNAKGWLMCLYPLVLETLAFIPRDESVKFGFDQQTTYSYNAGLVFNEVVNYPDDRLRNADGITKVAGWEFVPRQRTILTQPGDYLAYAWMAHFRNPNSEEARLTKPILDCIADHTEIGHIFKPDEIRQYISALKLRDRQVS